jgi:hypothetical protein
MSPEQAQQQRDLAFTNAMLGLERLPSRELGVDGAAVGILVDLQRRIAAIEAAEAPGGQPRPEPAGSDEERIQQVMAEMAARGHGRI